MEQASTAPYQHCGSGQISWLICPAKCRSANAAPEQGDARKGKGPHETKSFPQQIINWYRTRACMQRYPGTGISVPIWPGTGVQSVQAGTGWYRVGTGTAGTMVQQVPWCRRVCTGTGMQRVLVMGWMCTGTGYRCPCAGESSPATNAYRCSESNAVSSRPLIYWCIH